MRALNNLKRLKGRVYLDQFHVLLGSHIRERVYNAYCRGKTHEQIIATGIRDSKYRSYELYAELIGVEYEDVRKCIKMGDERPSEPNFSILADMRMKAVREYIVEDVPKLCEKVSFVAER